MCIHSVQGFSLFQVVLLYDVTSNIYFCSSLREQLFIFFPNQKENLKKKQRKCAEGLRSLLKATFFKDEKAAADILFVVRVDSMQHLPCFVLLGLGRGIWAFIVCAPSAVFCHTVVLFTHLPQRVGPDPRTRHPSRNTGRVLVRVWALLSLCCSEAGKGQSVCETWPGPPSHCTIGIVKIQRLILNAVDK